MKFIRAFLQVFAVLAAAAAVTLAVIAYWEKIVDFVDCIREKVTGKSEGYCFCDSSEYDDYADWDE